jgi:uncharacterized protein
MVQELLTQNMDKRYRKPIKNTSLLTGLVKCPECGSMMRPKMHRAGSDKFSYICEVKEKSRGKLCNVSNVAGNELDKNVVETVKILLDSENDIISELVKPGRDPRDELPQPILSTDVLDIGDLKPGMLLTGTVRNVADFGAFVDIGVHQDGLVHISQLSDRFVRNPMEVVSVGDIVKVRVIDVDVQRKRISLSMKSLE